MLFEGITPYKRVYTKIVYGGFDHRMEGSSFILYNSLVLLFTGFKDRSPFSLHVLKLIYYSGPWTIQNRRRAFHKPVNLPPLELLTCEPALGDLPSGLIMSGFKCSRHCAFWWIGLCDYHLRSSEMIMPLTLFQGHAAVQAWDYWAI